MTEFEKKIIESPEFPMHRALVVEYGAKIEMIVKYSLSAHLNIFDVDKSPSFGNAGGLDFSQTLNLFLELGGVDKNDKETLLTFAVIRNKFAHQKNVESIYQCLALNRHLKEKLEKNYSPTIDNYKFDYENSIRLLFRLLENLNIILGKIHDGVIEICNSHHKSVLREKRLELLETFRVAYPNEPATKKEAIELIQKHIDEPLAKFGREYANPYHPILKTAFPESTKFDN